MKRVFFPAILLFFCLLSCSKNEKPENSESVGLTGVFTDSPVEGVRYETETKTGFTDAEGHYDYVEGEIVTFYIGNIKLGSALATGELSPISIASTADADIYSLEVQNIAALLQTLDIDANPDNGIKITSEVVAAISAADIDFTQNSIQILGEIVLEVFQSTGISLEVVYPENAAGHLAQTLGIEFQAQDLFLKNFLPVFKDFYGHNSKIYQWIFEFQEDGKLKKATKYEKYPSRVLNEFIFSDYADNNVKVNNNINQYAKHLVYEENVKVYYDENFSIIKVENLRESDPTPFVVITNITSKNFIKNIEHTDAEGTVFYRREYQYDAEGFLTKILNTPGELPSFYNLAIEVDNTYTDFGDLKTVLDKWETKTDSNEFFYREDNTLEKIVYVETILPNFERQYSVWEYDENEAFVKDSTTYNTENGFATQYVEIYEEGIKTISKNYYNDILSTIYWYEPDGNGGSYLVKTKTYDEQGNLESTTCYDRAQSIIECTD